MPKQPPCCARKTAKLTMDRANLVRLARHQAKAAQRDETVQVARWQVKIEENKLVIAADEQAILDHEAEHADGRI